MNDYIIKEERKQIAISYLQQLGIYKPYINGFKAKDQKVCMFERFGGYWVYQYPELEAKIKEIEEKYDCTVYAVTHEYTAFGECYDFLLVTHYGEDAEEKIYESGGVYYPYAYVWNHTDDWCSEFGEIGVKSFGGGIARVA